MYSKKSKKIGIKFTNVDLINLINLIILIRLAILTSQINSNNALDRLIETQISKTVLNLLEIPLDFKTTRLLDFRLRSINIKWIIISVLNVAIQVIMLVVALIILTQTK